MMHDFAMTADHVVFMDLPIVFDLDIAIKGDGDMPYRWSDSYGARLGVLRRDDPFGVIRWFDIDPCYVFHVANAFEDANSIVLQAARYPELWRNDGGFGEHAVLWEVADRPERRHGRRTPARRPRGSSSRGSTTGWPGCRRATRCRWETPNWCATICPRALPRTHSFGPGVSGEAVFVPGDRTGRREQRLVHQLRVRPASRGSDLVILDASDFGAHRWRPSRYRSGCRSDSTATGYPPDHRRPTMWTPEIRIICAVPAVPATRCDPLGTVAGMTSPARETAVSNCAAGDPVLGVAQSTHWPRCAQNHAGRTGR